MLIEAGRIVELAEDRVWLDMEPRRARCAGCKGSCGFAFLGQRCAADRRICVPLPLGRTTPLEIGQQVEVGLPTAPLLSAVLLSYLVPLLGFFAGLLLSSYWLPGGGEGLALAAGLLGLVAGAMWVRTSCRRRLAEPPQLLRTLPSTEAVTVVSRRAPHHIAGWRQLMDLDSIRNFCLIAHIDHGKSTLADRFIQLCGGLSDREMSAQVLDSMDLERERGITIKAQCVALDYRAYNGRDYRLNLIDTPGHVDFSYEVSRSLAACEGALLLVDASQGVEAQSVANCHTAVDQGLTVLPVLNKMDLQSAEPERVLGEIEEIIGLDVSSHCRISAKTGADVEAVLEAVVHSVPPPHGDPDGALQALIIDSWFDRYLGVVSLVRVVHGTLHRNARVMVASTGATHQVERLGRFRPQREFSESLGAGEVGFVIAGVKDIHAAPVGDTLTADTATVALAGFRRVSPRVYAGLYPLETDQFSAFREALGRLALNDAALRYEPSSSDALGAGFRCGFLGLLHMEIVQARLEREYFLELIASAPSVAYRVTTTAGEDLDITNPADMPDPARISASFEPMVSASILTPKAYLGALLELCMKRRGVQKSLQYVGNQVCLEFQLPMSEVILDFFDRLKSLSRGFASLDYNFSGYQAAPLARVDILLNGERLDALAGVVHRGQVSQRGRQLVERMKELLPRQMFDIAIQAVVGSRVIARQTVRARRKNVTAKCYGGDISRKKKLLEKQRAGKRRMKRLGRVDVPQEAFMALLRLDPK